MSPLPSGLFWSGIIKGGYKDPGWGLGVRGQRRRTVGKSFALKGGDLGDIIAVELGLATGITAQHHDAR